MSLDSIYNYAHVSDSNQVIYLDKWKHYSIPFDDIDTEKLFDIASNQFPQLLFDEDEDDATLSLNASTLGAKAYKNRRMIRDKVWIDLGLERFMNGGHMNPELMDKTILPPLHSNEGEANDSSQGVVDSDGSTSNTAAASLADFLSNGYAAHHNQLPTITSPDVGDSSLYHAADFTINSTDFSHNTFLNLRSSSHNQSHQHQQQMGQPLNQAVQPVMQTPRIGRTRQLSSDRNFQTPITRIMR
jgi:hypothetical protein